MREESLSSLRKSTFNLLCKVEQRFEKDSETYRKAIAAFVKQAEKVSAGSDGTVQKALFNFAKDVVQTVQKGRKKNAGAIPVQNTARARRRIKHRGAGPSQSGRPTNEQSLKLQLEIINDEEMVSYQIPSRKKSKPKHPHSLAASVEANRAAERKH